jgi:hypothetical protein
MSTESPDERHECDLCGLAFSSEEQLQRHIHQDHETTL